MIDKHKEPKPTIYDQENPGAYVPPKVDSGNEKTVLPFPDRRGEILDEEGIMLSPEAISDTIRDLDPKSKAIVATAGALVIGLTLGSINKESTGQTLDSIFRQAESLVGINHKSPSAHSLKNFSLSGEKINITTA